MMCIARQDGSIQQLKILRILRLMRLFKLLRILRSGRVFRRLEDILKMGYAMMTLLKFIFGTLAIAHWMACAWMMVQGLEGSCTNWIITYFPPKFDEFGEEIDFCGPIPLEECEENSYRLTCTDCETCDCSVPCGKYFEVRQMIFCLLHGLCCESLFPLTSSSHTCFGVEIFVLCSCNRRGSSWGSVCFISM